MSENQQKQEAAEADPLTLQMLELTDWDHKKCMLTLFKETKDKPGNT